MSKLTGLTIEAMRGLLERGDCSPLELIDAHLERIAAVNPKINAFVSVFADEARAAARAPLGSGPLAGIPVTIKDSFDIEGYPTLCGSKFRLGTRAGRDATSVARLKAAGAILLGKTNTPEFLAMYETDNHIVGRTNNPWDLARTPGGSSGGESAAIAAGCSAGGIGSDGGGSVRLPAHFCGIAGLKPTPGRMPATGHYPLIQHPGGLLGVGGPMGRTVADVAALFHVMKGHDPADPFSAPVPDLPVPAALRVGVMEQFPAVPVQASARVAVRKAAALLGQLAGVSTGEFTAAGLERAPNVWSFFFSELAVPYTRETIQGREEDAHWTGTEFYNQLKDKPEPTGRQVVENLASRDAIRRRMLEQMAEVPVIVMPACGVAAFPHRTRRYATESKEIGLFQAMMPLTWVNLVGFPSLVVPITMDEEGMPVGVQLIGRPWEEETLLSLGRRLEEIRDPLPPFPSL